MKKIVSVVLLVAMVFGLVGCATQAGTGAGIGAALGGIAGAIICKGRTDCIVAGAALGGFTGLAIGAYQDKQLADRNAAVANYNNAQTHDDHQIYVENNKIKQDFLTIEKGEVNPSPVKAGGEATTVIQYTLLSQYEDEKDIPIIEKRYLLIDGDKIDLGKPRHINIAQGTRVSAYKFQLPESIDPGTYHLVTEISGINQIKKITTPVTVKG